MVVSRKRIEGGTCRRKAGWALSDVRVASWLTEGDTAVMVTGDAGSHSRLDGQVWPLMVDLMVGIWMVI